MCDLELFSKIWSHFISSYIKYLAKVCVARSKVTVYFIFHKVTEGNELMRHMFYKKKTLATYVYFLVLVIIT